MAWFSTATSAVARQEEAKFVMASDCVQRVMVGHLLEHWEWALVAKLTEEVSACTRGAQALYHVTGLPACFMSM